ncbi:MAG TPA: DUF2703 domain-containing protein [Arenibaculum sp.]|nr:DUF2703 domain-containing protein [Arenibaculum sp.]
MSAHGYGAARVAEMPEKPRARDRDLTVDLYYIDIDTCDRCQGASSRVDAAVAEVAGLLEGLGVGITVRKTLVETKDQAQRLRLVSSPSIRIDGRDIQPEVVEDLCGACSTLPNQSSVDCRIWSYRGEGHKSPPKGLIVEALLRAAVNPPATGGTEPYVMPDNLVAFFSKKAGAPARQPESRPEAAACGGSGSACGCG